MQQQQLLLLLLVLPMGLALLPLLQQALLAALRGSYCSLQGLQQQQLLLLLRP